MTHINVGHCIVGFAAAAALLAALGVSGATLAIVTASLACPLMMFATMRAMTGRSSPGGDQPADHRHR